MRSLSLAIVLVGCYHANAVTGVPCAANGECPTGQTCDMSRSPPTCVAPGHLLDAAMIDTAPLCSASMPCGPSAPVCDATTQMCRGCVDDSECSGGACTEYNGLCVADAEVIYLAPTGADAGTCTSAAPCATLAAALAQVTATRRTIRVADGTYNSPAATITDTGGRIVISGQHTRSSGATLGYAGTAPIITTAASTDVVVEGITVIGSAGDGIDYTGALILSHVHLDRNNDGVRSVSAVGSPASLDVREGLVSNSGNRGIDVQNGTVQLSRTRVNRNGGDSAIQIQNAGGTIVNCIVSDNTSHGIRAQSLGGQTVTIAFSTIAFNTSNPGVQGDVGVTLVDSIVVAPAGGQTLTCNGTCTVTYSLFSDVAPAGTGNIVADPKFANVATHDYHILSGSPANDAADPLASLKIDFDGNARPLGAGFDMGAYEIP